MAHMEIPSFIHDLVDAAILAGIATENPTRENLGKARQAIDEVKRKSGCYIKDPVEFRRYLPNYAQMMDDPKYVYAEILRNAVREVGYCGIEALWTELNAEQKAAGY